MKYHRHTYNPSGVPVGRNRNYLGTDGRWLVGFPVGVLALVMTLWAGAASIRDVPAGRTEPVVFATDGYQAVSKKP